MKDSRPNDAAGSSDLPEPELNVVIGIPSALPRDGRYTTAAVNWANNVVCKSIIDQLRVALPLCRIKIGTADVAGPEIRLEEPRALTRIPHVEALAKKAIRSAVRRACLEVDTLAERPEGSWVLRSLEAMEIVVEGRITEYRLILEGLWPAQCEQLEKRGWTAGDGSATISLPIDAYEREVEWLRSFQLI